MIGEEKHAPHRKIFEVPRAFFIGSVKKVDLSMNITFLILKC